MVEEKMVPIDTSGNSVEVTLKEEKKDEIPVSESNVREIIEGEEEVVETEEEVIESPKEEQDPYKTDDLGDYSKTVKKRINNLVGRMREMERAM